MSTSTLTRFLSEISSLLRSKNSSSLSRYLILEPPLPPLYDTLRAELSQSFPSSRPASHLLSVIGNALPEYEAFEASSPGGSWTAFNLFMSTYLITLRDLRNENLLDAHELLKSLLGPAITTLSDSVMGATMLETVISISRTLARLAIGLSKHPELIDSMSTPMLDDNDSDERVSLVESSANLIREAFKKCLSDRTAPLQSTNGKRRGIYVLSNLCLRLFFYCGKLRSAEQIFTNIYQQSPPLSLFPASQRVQFLLYLGRYYIANNHFGRAALALDAAYTQCHRLATSQRRRILLPLIVANLILGRFPSMKMFALPEARGWKNHFAPICDAIRRGDLQAFHALMDLDHPTGQFLLRYRLLFQLRNRAEVLVFRSLVRRAFLLTGSIDRNGKRPPTLEITDLKAMLNTLELRMGYVSAEQDQCTDPDLDENLAVDANGEIEPTMSTSTKGMRFLSSIEEVECRVASLCAQGLMHGYITHGSRKFVVLGSKGKNPVDVGWPNIWNLLGPGPVSGVPPPYDSMSDADVRTKDAVDVPGWVTRDMRANMPAGGRIVNLSGARPVGVPG